MLRDINEMIEQMPSEEKGKVRDGYHSFDELYEHRIVLYIALALSIAVSDHHSLSDAIWRSKKHSDETNWDGWFLLGIGIEWGSQITYHLPMRFWNNCDFAHTFGRAPKFDGHTSQDVLKRISEL